uniref:Elongator complex protein 6 n=1 Tax=Crocodylus porosus TaxID=8502 RepID=A0A7M4E0S0_CROPO
MLASKRFYVPSAAHQNSLSGSPAKIIAHPTVFPRMLNGTLQCVRTAAVLRDASRGVSLPAAKERGQLVFLEGLKSCFEVLFKEEPPTGQPNPLQFIREGGSNLKALYEFVRTSLTPSESDSWKCPVLLVDDVSVLLSLGMRPVDVLDFIHYCRVTVCSQLKGNIVVLVHSSEDSDDTENELVVNALCHQSNLILWAEGLATGFCKDIHGQLKIIPRGPAEPSTERDLPRTYQYKIQDRNVTFFARGMSTAVL